MTVRAMGADLRREWPPRRRAAEIGTAASGATLALWLAGGPIAGGLALLAFAAAVSAFYRPDLFGPLVLLLLPAGTRIELLHSVVAPLEAAVGGGAIGYAARLLARPDERRFQPAHWIFALFVLFIGLSAFGPAGGQQVHEFLFVGALGFLFHSVTMHLDHPRRRRVLLLALATPILIETSLTFYEYVDRWSQRFSRLGGAIVYPLPEGTLRHANALGMFLVFAGLALVALALAERGVLARWSMITVGASAVALLVTFSRASWIALAVGACVYVAERRTRMIVVAAGLVATLSGALLALVTGGAIGQRITSLFTVETNGLSDFRIVLAKKAAHIAASHPLTGTGHFEVAGTYAGRPDVATHPHNLFLGLAVFYGIPAAVAFGMLVLLAMRASLRGFRHFSGSRRLTALGFLAVLVAIVVNGIFEYPFWNVSLTVLVVVILAVATTLDCDRDTPPEPSPRG